MASVLNAPSLRSADERADLLYVLRPVGLHAGGDIHPPRLHPFHGLCNGFRREAAREQLRGATGDFRRKVPIERLAGTSTRAG